MSNQNDVLNKNSIRENELFLAHNQEAVLQLDQSQNQTGEPEEEEENAIIELDQVSILASSKLSLRKRATSMSASRKSELNKEAAAKVDLTLEPVEEDRPSHLLQFKGQLLGFLSAFLTALSVIIIKKAYLLSGTEQVFIRYFIQTIFTLCLAYYKNINVFKNKNKQGKISSFAF